MWKRRIAGVWPNMTAAAPIILVVEDEALVQVLVSRCCRSGATPCSAARSAEEALALLRDHCSDDRRAADGHQPGRRRERAGAGAQGAGPVPRHPRDLRHRRRHPEGLAERVPDSLLIPKPYELDEICEEVARALPPRRAG